MLGADPSARTQPPHVRSQLAALEREQKTRATRFARDVVDRSLVDLLSVYRDALVLHTGASVALVNQDMADHVQRAGRRRSGPSSCCRRWTRSARPASGSTPTCAPLLALEAMAISLQLPR